MWKLYSRSVWTELRTTCTVVGEFIIPAGWDCTLKEAAVQDHATARAYFSQNSPNPDKPTVVIDI